MEERNICGFRIPDYPGYHSFAGALKEDGRLWYGELPQDYAEGPAIVSSLYSGTVQCILSFLEQPYDEKHFEIEPLLGRTEIMWMTDFKVPPEKIYEVYIGENLPQVLKDNMERNETHGFQEGKVKLVHASKISPRIEEGSALDFEIYYIFKK